MKYRVSLILVFVLLINFIFCPIVKAEEFSDLDDIIAVWDPNLDTSWDTVFNEYKTLDPQTMDKADTVIASNMFRFLMSVGSKPKGKLTQTDYSNFVKATSPFYIAYNGITSAPEVTVHAAWSISSDAFKIFCANVIHNLAQQSTYYDTHVLKNDNFLNDAGKGHLNFIYNDIDNNTEINIANNIFNGNFLTSSGSSIGNFYFNPTPLGYNGVDISLDKILAFKDYYKSLYPSSPFVVYPYATNIPSINDSYKDFLVTQAFHYFTNYPGNSDSVCILVDVQSSTNTYSGYFEIYGDRWFYIADYLSPRFSTFGSSYSRYFVFSSRPFISTSEVISYVSSWFAQYLDYFVYLPEIYIRFSYSNTVSYFKISNFNFSFVSPQFVPVNIYNNQVYTSSEDTYWHVDTMVDNIINYDYSTVNNGTDNTFYINNYYVPETVSNGAIQLVTSSSIVYNYTTIINNNGTSSGGSIGSYPYPFDVRIINPEDIKNETDINVKNDILNDYDINFGDLNINSGLSIALNNANDSFTVVKDNPAFIFLGGFLQCLPTELYSLFIGLGSLILIIGVYNLVTHKGGSG